MTISESLYQAALEELTEGHLALDRLGAPREIQSGDDIHECLIAERIAGVAQAVPEGWKLVPIELTDAMRWAGGSALHDHGEDTEGIWRAILNETPEMPSQHSSTDSPAQAPLSEEERHAVEHARYQVGQASMVKPDCCFDYELVKDLLRAIDRAYPLPSTHDKLAAGTGPASRGGPSPESASPHTSTEGK